MYIGIDIGGTKTLACVLNNEGVIRERVKFPTPQNYDEFLANLRDAVASFEVKDFKAGGVGMPGVLDRDNGRGINFGNLPWKDVPVQHDVEKIAHCPIVIENDAKMAGLSEAMLLKDHFSRVLYVTVSTGIGLALVVDQVIDDNIGDAGGKSMMIEYRGKRVPWESFASGHAIVERYGKRAVDIHDDETWTKICRDLAPGLIELIALTEPEVIVFGGGVGTYFDRWGHILAEQLKTFEMPLLKLPKLHGAKRAEEAVVYGCYDLARQTFPHA